MCKEVLLQLNRYKKGSSLDRFLLYLYFHDTENHLSLEYRLTIKC